jgi:predicted lipoprotein with Yx(FWY)xxD motif
MDASGGFLVHRMLRHVAAAAVLALALAACGGEPDDEVTTDVEEAADTEEEADTEDDAADGADDGTAAPDDAGGALLETASLDLGEILVDADGMTLYLFDPDEQGPSTCYDECAGNWPPLLTDGDPAAGTGVDEALLGTTERDDGTSQVTYGGWPLYHWAADEAEGDATGQGVQDVWWVLAPDGTPIRDTADAGSAGGDGDDEETETSPSY